MKHVHPLKVITLGAWLGLLVNQLSLVYQLLNSSAMWIALALVVILLVPARGLLQDRRYTYKWVGFLTLLYLAIGISETFSNPLLRYYGILSIIFSCLLFFSSIYYSRYLRQGG